MKEPASWWKPGGISLLSPAAALYGAVTWMRMRARGEHAGVPVICLGNLTLGGAGKTPAALAVARILLAAHERPFFLSRGYGGSIKGPVRVNPGNDRAREVGDEPLMLARLAPTIVSRDRVKGATTARTFGAGVIVMDDGFQNPSLAKDLSILVVEGSRGIGNGRIFPAGPLRAPLGIQIRKAQAVVVIGPPQGASPVLAVAKRAVVPIFHARLEPDSSTIAALGGRKVLAFAGIGNPEKFFATLTEAGIEIGEYAAFPDHHRYTAREARALLARAEAASLVLMTTEKDLVRLNGERRLATLAARATALPVRLVVKEQDAFRDLVLNAVAAARQPLRP